MVNPTLTMMDRKAWIVVILGIVIIVALMLNARNKRTNPPPPTQPTIEKPIFQEKVAHIDGYDSATGEIITPLNVWSNYDTRSFAYKIDHGATVTMIDRTADGNGVKIRDASGREGWITYFFIKELK